MFKPGWINEPLYSEIKELMPLPCVDLLIIHEDRLLLMKRRNQPGQGLWFTPGGRIYKNESIEDAVKRVLLEETGLIPTSIIQSGAMSHYWPEVQTITVFHRVEVTCKKVEMNNEHTDYKWVERLEESFHPYLKYMIKTAKIFKKESE